MHAALDLAGMRSGTILRLELTCDGGLVSHVGLFFTQTLDATPSKTLAKKTLDLLGFGVPYFFQLPQACLLYTSPSPRDATLSRMPSSA